MYIIIYLYLIGNLVLCTLWWVGTPSLVVPCLAPITFKIGCRPPMILNRLIRYRKWMDGWMCFSKFPNCDLYCFNTFPHENRHLKIKPANREGGVCELPWGPGLPFHVPERASHPTNCTAWWYLLVTSPSFHTDWSPSGPRERSAPGLHRKAPQKGPCHRPLTRAHLHLPGGGLSSSSVTALTRAPGLTVTAGDQRTAGTSAMKRQTPNTRVRDERRPPLFH